MRPFARSRRPSLKRSPSRRLRASGHNLLVSAIILWNTKYLEEAYTELRRQGGTINDDLLRHVALFNEQARRGVAQRMQAILRDPRVGREGFPPKRVQALMGHSSIGITFDT
jgi:hypothetical protein